MSYLTRAYGAVKLFGKAHAPTIMVTSGVISMGAAVVTAGKATLKVEDVFAKHTPNLEKIAQGEKLTLANYTKDDARSDRIKVYTATGIDLTKLYAVPGVLFIGGAALVFGGHHIMLKRNATLALAFTGLKKSFDAYRARVVNQWGSEADQAMMSGYNLKEVVDPETNEVKTIAARDWDLADQDPYNRVFDRWNSTQWQDDLSVNKMFVAQQVKMAQILLGQRGYVYLSELYEALGFTETDISRVVGWKVEHYPDGTKNIPVIDVGLDKPHPDDWKFSREGAIYLDFNCQGLIIGGKVQKALEAAR